MKITRVEPFLMSCPLAEPLELPFFGGMRTILKRDAMFIRVSTDAGIRGYAPGPAHERAEREIRETIAPFLEGRDPLAWECFGFPAGEDIVKTYRAVEIAVMDVVARAEERPISELAGGRKRDRIKLYGSAGMYMSPERFAEEAAAIQALGFPAYKMRSALGPERDLETVERMRSATGPGFGLMIDGHSWWRMGDRSYDFDTVATLAASMAAFDPVWLEEPLIPDDHEAYRRLRALGHIPLATGEHEHDESGYLDLIATGAADWVQMDLCCQGGFDTARRVADAVEKKGGLRFAFHSWGTTLEVLAAAHFGITFSEQVIEWLEYPCYSNAGRPGMYPFPLADEILTEPLTIENGYLVVPDGPGLGITVNEDVIEKYPFIPGPWSLFHIDSPKSAAAVTGDHSLAWARGA